MSKKSIVIISIITIFVVAVIYFLPNAWSKDDGITAGNNDWKDDYYSNIADSYEDDEMPPQSSPQSPDYLDVVTPISKYFTYENANGYGTISLYMDWDTVKDLRIQVGDIYLQPGKNSYYSDNCDRFLVIKDNKEIGYIKFTFSKNKGLTKGDKITVYTDYFQYDSDEECECYFMSVEIEVPDLGEYLTTSNFTRKTAESLEDIVNIVSPSGQDIHSIWYGKIKQGEINYYNSPGCLLVIYGRYTGNKYYYRGHVFYDVIVNTDGSITNYKDYSDSTSPATEIYPYGLGSTTNWNDVEHFFDRTRKYYNLECVG